MKIINQKVITLSILFVTGLVLVFFLVYLNPSARNEIQPPFNYLVEQGETCLEIAHTFGVSIVNIVKLNNLRSDCSDIYPGQNLLIPYPVPTITPPGFVSPTRFAIIDCVTVRYTVKIGDTLESISREYNTPVKTLIDYNGIMDEKIQGSILVIPLCYRTSEYMDDPTATYSPEPIIDIFTACQEIILTVLPGDTLDSISLNYSIPKKYIMEYNRMNTDEVFPGMVVLIQLCRNMPTPTVTPSK